MVHVILAYYVGTVDPDHEPANDAWHRAGEADYIAFKIEGPGVFRSQEYPPNPSEAASGQALVVPQATESPIRCVTTT